MKMAILNQKKILNLIPKVSAPVTLHVSQGDVGTMIEFTLVKGDELFVDTGNLSASVHGVREDGANFGAYTCTLNGSKLSFPLHSEMTAIKGSAIAEVVLVDNQGNKVGSSNFGILVEESVFPLGVTYDNDVSVYESILAYVQTIPAQVTQDYTTKINAEIAARQAADSSLNEALANEISARQSAVSSEASTRAAADANLQSQIDEIIAPSGEAPSAAEVQNARIGADGKTYDTLGNAIRGQITEIGKAFKNENGFEQIPLVNDGYIVTSGSTIDVTDIRSGSFKYAVVNCSAGDRFHVVGKGGTNPGLWCFCNASNQKLSGVQYTGYQDLIITAPENTNYLVVNVNTAENYGLYKAIDDTGMINVALCREIFPPQVDNSYWADSGQPTAYDGWRRTTRVKCVPKSIIKFVSSDEDIIRYCYFFNSDLDGDINRTFILTKGETYIIVPENAHYFAISGTNAMMNGIQIYLMLTSEDIATQEMADKWENKYNENIVFSIIPHKYLSTQDGSIFPTNDDWSISNPIYCHGYKYFGFNSAELDAEMNYSWFYDEDMQPISRFGWGNVAYTPIIHIPTNAYYAVLGQVTSSMKALKLTKVSQEEFDANISTARLDLIEKQNILRHAPVITFSESDFEYGKLDPQSQASELHRIRTKDLMFEAGTKYTLSLDDEDLVARVYYYSETNAQLDAYTRRSNWGNSIDFLLNTNEVCIRVEFGYSDTDAWFDYTHWFAVISNLCIYRPESMVNVSLGKEYIRVCTFNMAKTWPAFNVVDADFAEWLLHTYHNLYGDINPDIMGMQEAYGYPGTYIDKGETYLQYADTLKQKFDYEFSDTGNNHIVSKYPILSTVKTNYPSEIQRGSGRYFTKSIIPMGNKKLGFFNTHIDYKGDFNEYQGPQVSYLCDAMITALNNNSCDYVIAVADFNVWDDEAFVNLVKSKGFKVANSDVFGAIPTWNFINYVDENDLITNPEDPTGEKIPKVWNQSKCDNIIVSANIEIQKVGAVAYYPAIDWSEGPRWWPIKDADGNWQAPSDHYPFWADLRLM